MTTPMMAERCRCEHVRNEHADRLNPLQVVPVSMTEADEEPKQQGLSPVVRGVGHCTVEGCDCRQFSPVAED